MISCSGSARTRANPNEIEDGDELVRIEAAHSLQPSGPTTDPNYEQVGLLQTALEMVPTTDEYAPVATSKKTKKKKVRMTKERTSNTVFLFGNASMQIGVTGLNFCID